MGKGVPEKADGGSTIFSIYVLWGKMLAKRAILDYGVLVQGFGL